MTNSKKAQKASKSSKATTSTSQQVASTPAMSSMMSHLDSLGVSTPRLAAQAGIFTGSAIEEPKPFTKQDGTSGLSCIFHSACGNYKHTLLASMNDQGRYTLLDGIAIDNQLESLSHLFDGRDIKFAVTENGKTVSNTAYNAYGLKPSNDSSNRSRLLSRLTSRR